MHATSIYLYSHHTEHSLRSTEPRRSDHQPDRTPRPRKALADRGQRRQCLCGHCRPVAVRAHPSPLYGLGEASRGGGSREPPGERLSHTWCRRRVILRHHVCERTSLVALTLLLPYRGAQLVRAAVGHGEALRGAAPPGIAGSAAEPLPNPRERAFANCGTPPDTPRSSIESVNTSRQLQQPPIAPFPVSDVASASCGHQTLKNKRQKHLSGETPRRNDE